MKNLLFTFLVLASFLINFALFAEEQSSVEDSEVESVKTEDSGLEADDSISGSEESKNWLSDRKVITSILFLGRFSAGERMFEEDQPVQDPLGMSILGGMQIEVLFLKMGKIARFGIIADLTYEYSLADEVNLVGDTGKYGTVDYLWSALPMGGFSFQFYFTEKFRFGLMFLGGYDITQILVSQYGKDEKQLGAGFVAGGGLSFGANIPVSDKLALLVELDCVFRYGRISLDKDVMMHNWPPIPDAGFRFGFSF